MLCSSESLCRFGDTTVPFATAFIQEHDPFINHEARGVTLYVSSIFPPHHSDLPLPSDLDEKYSPLIESYHVPLVPPPTPPKPRFWTVAYWKSRNSKSFLPPVLQYRFPGNLVGACSFLLRSLSHIGSRSSIFYFLSSYRPFLSWYLPDCHWKPRDRASESSCWRRTSPQPNVWCTYSNNSNTAWKRP